MSCPHCGAEIDLASPGRLIVLLPSDIKELITCQAVRAVLSCWRCTWEYYLELDCYLEEPELSEAELATQDHFHS